MNRAILVSLYAVALALAVLLAVAARLGLGTNDLSVPLNYWGDTLIQLMYIKGLIEEGWPIHIMGLSAPFGYSGAAFPLQTSFDWLVIKLLSLVIEGPGTLLNAFWLLTLVFSAWSAAFASRQLGLTPFFSAVAGLLFGTLPYAFIRNVAHLNLAYYLVPLLCLLAVVIARNGAGIRNPVLARNVGLLACVAQGFNYVYYSFFAVLLFAIAAAIGYRRGDAWKTIRLPLLAIAIIGTATAANLAPSFASWHSEGKPPELGYKYTAEAEILGIKLRKLLMPHPENPVGILARLGKKDAQANFPNENENVSARLGLYAAWGFLLIIANVLFAKGHAARVETTVARLGLATFLIITVGGIGAVVNLVTVPDIRAYNRFAVFLAFFSLVMAGLQGRRLIENGDPWRKRAVFVLLLGFIALSCHDQLLDGKFMNARWQGDMSQADRERTTAAALQREFPRGSAFLQLPLTGYPPLARVNAMDSYDHARPYFWTTGFRWSWPSFSQRHREWQTQLAGQHGADLVKAAVLSDFAALWIDRSGYPDQARQLAAELLAVPNVRQVALPDERILLLDLRAAAAALMASMGERQYRRERAAYLDRPLLVWEKGFHGEEESTTIGRFRWAREHARVSIRNPGSTPMTVCMRFGLGSPNRGKIRLSNGVAGLEVEAAPTPEPVRFIVSLGPNERQELRFDTDLPSVVAPGETRKLTYYLAGLEMATADDSSICGKAIRPGLQRVEDGRQ